MVLANKSWGDREGKEAVRKASESVVLFVYSILAILALCLYSHLAPASQDTNIYRKGCLAYPITQSLVHSEGFAVSINKAQKYSHISGSILKDPSIYPFQPFLS